MLPHAIKPLIHPGIFFASLSAVGLNLVLNGAARVSVEELREAAMEADGGHRARARQDPWRKEQPMPG